MILAGKYEVPDTCEGCPWASVAWGQGDICFRCPIFNCLGDDPMLPPEEYRADWAEEWERWFKTDRRDWPVLEIKINAPASS